MVLWSGVWSAHIWRESSRIPSGKKSFTAGYKVETLHSPTLRRYIDPGKLDPLLIRLEEASASELTFSDLRMANVLYSCSLFLKEV